jgi:predicted GIY-YIG superfamily endonuclease
MADNPPSSSSSLGLLQSGGPPTFFCYLLHSHMDPRSKRTYIGFTNNPIRRLRQHNDQIEGGARHTMPYRPWVMIACVYGFPSMVAALHFEWAWQWPRASRLVRGMMERNHTRHGDQKIKFSSSPIGQMNLLYSMLSLQPWCHFNLHVRYLLEKDYNNFRIDTHFTARANIPPHIKISYGPLDGMEWASQLTKAKRMVALARGDGDTKGGEPEFVVPMAKKKPVRKVKKKQKKNGKNNANDVQAEEMKEESEEEEEGVRSASPSNPAAAASYEDEEVRLAEEEHELASENEDEEIDLRLMHPHVPGSHIAAPSNSSSVIPSHYAAAAQFAEAKQIQDDHAFALALAQSMNDAEGALMDSYNVGSVTGSLENDFGWMMNEEEDECVDMTVPTSPPVAAAASSSHSQLASSADTAASSCKLCGQHSPPWCVGANPQADQLTSFGFEKVMTVCPACRNVGHLLCFQREMQNYTNDQSAVVAGTVIDYPLLPGVAPCPFCKMELQWCLLVENTHRYNAPSAAAAAAATSADSIVPSSTTRRTITQYFRDASVAFTQVAKRHLQLLQAKEIADKQAKMDAKRTGGKGKKAPTTVVSASASANADRALTEFTSLFNGGQSSFFRSDDEMYDKENHSSVAAAAGSSMIPATPERGARKRRSRSLTPTRPPDSGSHSLTASSMSGSTRVQRSPPSNTVAASANKSSRPVRSLSVPFAASLQLNDPYDSVIASPPVKKAAKATTACLPPSNARTVAASASAAVVASSISRIEEEEFRPSQTSEDSSEVDMTHQSLSLWDRCEAKRHRIPSSAANETSLIATSSRRPVRSGSTNVNHLNSTSAAAACVSASMPLSLVHIVDSESEPEGHESEMKQVKGAGKEQQIREEMGLMERLARKYPEQIVLSL